MSHHGFLRVAAAVPNLRVADCTYNCEHLLALMTRAESEDVSVLIFPELSLTGYTCADLFQQETLRSAAAEALVQTAQVGRKAYSGIAVVGLPLAVDDHLFNCAAVLHRGKVLGLIPKSFLPNYKEFYEARWFAPAAAARSREVMLAGNRVPFGTDLLFEASDVEGLTLGVEICEDLWMPVPPSSLQALQGASVLTNLSASNEVIGKAAYRRQLVQSQSGRCIAGYIYSSCGVFESTTDVVFGGHCLIAENGTLLSESERFRRDETLLVADLDLDRLLGDRRRTGSFGFGWAYPGGERTFRRVPFALERSDLPKSLKRAIDAHPFVPRGQEQLRERCEEIFHTQVAGLAKRLDHIGRPPVTIGISGGLDSTLALVAACKTMDTLNVGRERVVAFTMPGFGTTERTFSNAVALMRQLKVTAREVDIRALCLEEMRVMGHKPFGVNPDGLTVEDLTAHFRRLPVEQRGDLVFENVQARMRTSILMNSGFAIGTGDVSELALGWCTYNGDHISMYNPNVSIPKTLVKFLVAWAAENEFDGEARRTLRDIVATGISPELLPVSEDGRTAQSTESVVGPYELQDFFLYHFLRFGAAPEKILYLAEQATFDQPYTAAQIRHWLDVFFRRFFANQFKRSCLPDGPKVGTVSLSPRGDWRMPSDAAVNAWLRWLDEKSPRDSSRGLEGQS
jgi:NAD+ synthase (glutamine-hydrolysing)